MALAAVSCKKDKPGNTILGGAVDLGIVMTREDGTTYKLYWAKSNLCASGLCANETDYGDHYSWGETEAKENYEWSTYKFGTDRLGPFSKYNTDSSYGDVDNKTVLDSGPEGDDAASKVLDGKWRVPTGAEWAALVAQCTWEWKDNYNGTGVNGRLVTATNGNSIFLPAAGFKRYDVPPETEGSRCYYWSSSLNTDGPNQAVELYSTSGNLVMGYGLRYTGYSIRPVWEK